MVFHFLKKDVRHNAWLLALWFLLFVIDGIAVLSARPPDINLPNLGLSPVLFLILKFLVLAVLVSQLIQKDAVVGSTAFWLTRPITRGTLLLAKLVGLGLIVLIPLLVESAVLVMFGVSRGELGWAALEILMHQLFFVVPIALLAALTPNFARFVAVTVTLAVGLIVISLRFAPFAAPAMTGIELENTKDLVETALLIVGGGLLLTHQYLTRQSRRSITLAICLVGAYILVALFWSMNLMPDVPLRSPLAVFDPAKATVRISAGSLNNSPYSFPSGSVGKNIGGYCAFSGIPPEFLVQVRSIVPRLSTPDGMKIATLGAVRTVPAYQFDPPATSAISAALGGIPVYSFTGSAAGTTFATIDHATFLRYKDFPVKLVDDIDLVVSRYELAAEMPLVVDSRYDKGGVHLRINGLVPSDDGVTIVIIESSVNLRFGETVHVSKQLTDPRQKGDPIYLLVNRGRKEAALASAAGSSSARSTVFDGLIVQQSVQLPFTNKDNPRSPTIDRQWLAGAALVRLERIPVAEFSRAAEADLPKLGEPWLSIKARESTASSITTEPLSKDQRNTGTEIGISKNGVITMDGKAVTKEELNALLVRTHAVDANASVLIIAEEGTEPEKMTLVVNACRVAGLSKLRIQRR
jgi:biopolymer transport protein ExbD